MDSDARNSSFAEMRKASGAFSLLEMLVAILLLAIIIVVVAQLTNQTSAAWKDSTQKIQSFQEARAAFESMTRKLGLATLNTYYDYYDATGNPRSQSVTLASFVPATYDRMSDLHFISGDANVLLKGSPTAVLTQTQAVFFQAVMGNSIDYPKLGAALNACGYYLSFDDASAALPAHVKNAPGYRARYRFRLMEMTQSTENLQAYYNPAAPNNWFVANAISSSRIIAENVIALVLLPKLPPNRDSTGAALAPKYNFNSRIPLGAGSDPSWTGFPPDALATGSGTRHHLLPSLMQVVLVVIDETSALRLQGNSTSVPTGINLAKTSLFTDATKLSSDIQAVEDICNAKSGNLTGNTLRLNYRVFNTDIQIREAKWSTK